MRFTNALFIGLSVLSFTFCRRQDEVKPDNQEFSNERTVGAASFTQFDYVIKTNESMVDASKLNLKPGAVVGIEAGTRKQLLLRNFIGTANQPITLVNKGGKVKIASTGSYGMKIEGAKHLRVTGAGDPSISLGLEINGGHIGISFDKFSTNFELDHVEISNCGFAGLMAKTDPSCDPATWRGNFTMRDISIHDNYVHDVKGEGLYIGNSFWDQGRNLECGLKYPHAIEGAKVYNNKTRNTGCEGIQVGCVTTGCEIFNNDVENFGISPFANHQNNGIQVGAGTGGKLYNNIIANGPGNGIIMLGLGDNVIYNNIIIKPGTNGIFMDERVTPGNGFTFINNTVINPGNDGVRIYSELVPMNTVVNNIVVKPGGKFIHIKPGSRVTESHNLFTNDIASVKFVAPGQKNYNLAAGSPAIDKGKSTANYGVTTDFRRVSRPNGTAYDIGAYEYNGSSNGGVTPAPNPDPDPEPQPGAHSVTSLTLIDANTHRDIVTLTDGYVIDLSKIGTDKFNVRANTNPSSIGSITFNLNGNSRTESISPYALFGDGSGKYNPGTFPTGTNTLSATAYSAANGAGTKGNTISVRFTVVNNSASTNRDPVIAPLSNVTMNEGETRVINISATDPDGDAIKFTAANLPVFAILQQAANNTASITVKPGTTHSGTYPVSVTATDSKGATHTVSFNLVINNVEIPTLINKKYTVTDDAFLHYKIPFNSREIRVEAGKRSAYLKFNVQGIGNEVVTKARIRLRCTADAGYGPLKVSLANTNNWSEITLNNNNKPLPTTVVGSINSRYIPGNYYEIDVTSAINGDGIYTFILDKEPGANDAAFNSKESGYAPELIIN